MAKKMECKLSAEGIARAVSAYNGGASVPVRALLTLRDAVKGAER